MASEQEYFIVANSFAAPFVSDQSTDFERAFSPESALVQFAKRYSHPCGLYAAVAYETAEAYHKGAKPLAKWVCNHQQAIDRATREQSSYVLTSHGPGLIEIDGKAREVAHPKKGSIV